MFEALTDRLNETFGRLSKKGRLGEADVDEAMREVRRALLEADVNFKVVRTFVATVRERAIGQEVLQSLTPAQTVIGIVHDELINILGREREPLRTPSGGPQTLMLVGLQGSGKTTHAAKLALYSRKQGRAPLLVAADVYRPAAVTQLQSLGRQLNIPVYDEGTDHDPVDIARNAIRHARERGLDPDHHRHGRPAPDRRAPHGGAGQRQGRGRPDRDPARRRRDDGPGGGWGPPRPSTTSSTSPG